MFGACDTLGLYSTRDKRVAGKNLSEMIYFVFSEVIADYLLCIVRVASTVWCVLQCVCNA